MWNQLHSDGLIRVIDNQAYSHHNNKKKKNAGGFSAYCMFSLDIEQHLLHDKQWFGYTLYHQRMLHVTGRN